MQLYFKGITSGVITNIHREGAWLHGLLKFSMNYTSNAEFLLALTCV